MRSRINLSDMGPIRFPDPRRMRAGESVIYAGGTLGVDSLRLAYAAGIFPWPSRGLPLLWHCPDPRGVLDFDELRVPRSMRQLRRRLDCELSFDRAFGRVVRACAETPRPGQEGTWITPEMLEAYCLLHAAGAAHSVECWLGGRLVGGLYGVYARGVFSGESMFHAVSGASKLCLWAAVEALRARGLRWMDVQMVTPVVELFGGKYIPRREFLDRVDAAHAAKFPERLSLAD